MSSGLDTVTRRQLRKAFGGDALKVLEAHEQGLLQHAAAIRTLIENSGALGERVESVAKDHAQALTEVRNDFYCRTLRGRLRWLLRGK